MTKPTTDQLRVLVADDDPIQRNLVGAQLAAFNGRMVEAEDGVVAWNLLTSQSFDMAIVDLGMPNLDGIALIECMRGHPRTRHLPIIVITSRSDKQAIRDAFAAGASSFLMKPIIWSAFEHLVGFLLRLVEAERRTRADCHRATALGRANETLLRNLSNETTDAVNEIRAQVEQLFSIWPGQPMPEALAGKLDAINEQCTVLRDYTRRIDTAMKTVNESIVVDNRKEQLTDLIGRVLRDFQPKADGAGVRINANARAAASLSCDADAIEMALTQLLDNAVANSPSGEAVNVSIEILPDGVLGIEVTDRGAGTHPDDIGRLLPSIETGSSGGGSPVQDGLGLLVARAIAEAHSGKLEVRSMLGQGTSALFTLPPERVSVPAS